jgi:hypothetical protein
MEIFSDEWFDRMEEGLALLGWCRPVRLSGDEELALMEISAKAIDAHNAGGLSDAVAEELSVDAYNILSWGVENVEFRTEIVTELYSKSPAMLPLVHFVDEVTLAYFRGYWTTALAGLFVILEAYLRAILGWRPGDPDVSFRQLREAVDRFEPSDYQLKAKRLLDGLYARYDPLSPTRFDFNRHGLMHGIRGPSWMDRMNCARTLTLLDSLVAAELGRGSRGYNVTDALLARLAAYQNCVYLGSERLFLGRE